LPFRHRLVELRGRLMQEAVPEGQGAMAAVLGLEDEQVVAVCEQAAEGEVLAAVNFNSPGQVVIAGTAAAVERAVHVAKETGAKRALKLAVSVPSHCALMKPAAERLAEALAEVEVRTPVIPVVHNADVAAYGDPAAIRDALVRQLYQPVRWVESMRYLEAQGVDTIVEAGPGKVLVGLNKRISAAQTALPVFDNDNLAAALNHLQGSEA